MIADTLVIKERVSVGIQPPSSPSMIVTPDALEYGSKLIDSGNNDYSKRILVGTAVTGLVRAEWVQARVGQTIPTNWSMVTMWQAMNSYMPLRYQVDDAQNLIVRECITGKYEWLLLWEHDVIPWPDAFLRFNEYMRRKDTPVVSGLYYTRSKPAEPLMFRKRGTSFVTDWKPGDLVWCDGVPTGMLLIHATVLQAVWNEAEEYSIGRETTRRVFHTPNNVWFDPDTGNFSTATGTSDLLWCWKLIEGDYLARRAGASLPTNIPNTRCWWTRRSIVGTAIHPGRCSHDAQRAHHRHGRQGTGAQAGLDVGRDARRHVGARVGGRRAADPERRQGARALSDRQPAAVDPHRRA